MSESYCLKSCSDCGKCSGCRGGAYAARCDIAKCCREKNHENCDSCTRGITCPTRRGRDNMPGTLLDRERREAERLAAKRFNAGVMAKWVWIIFWCIIAANVVGLLEFLAESVPVLGWVGLVAETALFLVIAYGYWQMKDIDVGFRTYAILSLISQGMSAVHTTLQEGPVRILIAIPEIIIVLIAYRTQYLAFRDALSGIDGEMSYKWLRQWNLFKISLLAMGAGLLFSIILSLLGLVIILGGIGVLLFVMIREYVYLYQTAQICRYFSDTENYG